MSFLTLGLLSAWAAGLAYVYRGDDVDAAIGFGTIPCVMPYLAALVLGPGLSLVLLVRWRDRLLMAAMGWLLLVFVAFPDPKDEFLWVPLAAYGAGATTLGLFWLLKARKRFS